MPEAEKEQKIWGREGGNGNILLFYCSSGGYTEVCNCQNPFCCTPRLGPFVVCEGVMLLLKL